jgi:hypothetical protein
MSTAAVSTNSIYQQLQAYFQQRGSDLQQLGQALKSGDLAGAQQEYSAIQTLGQSGPFASGDPFKFTKREQDFAAVGQALQSGDLAGAQQAFAQLKSSFQPRESQESSPAVVVNLSAAAPAASATASPAAASSSADTSAVNAASPAASTSGPEIILNLGNVTPGEQITIGLGQPENGSEQVTIGVAGQTNQSPEQISFNLNLNSNQQIILNLFNGTGGSSAASSTLSTTA